MARSQAGDRDAYATVLRWLADRASTRCHAVGLETAQTDMVIRDCLLLAHQIRHTFDPGQALAPWADAILRHALAQLVGEASGHGGHARPRCQAASSPSQNMPDRTARDLATLTCLPARVAIFG
jgi:hypothetical protein